MFHRQLVFAIVVLSFAMTSISVAQALVDDATGQIVLPVDEESPIVAPEAPASETEITSSEDAVESEPAAAVQPESATSEQPQEKQPEPVAAQETESLPYAIPRLALNEVIPGFVLPDVLGDSVRVPEDVAAQYVVILFFRGAWDPYAQRQLQSISGKYQTLRGLNAFVVAISADSPDALATLRKANLYPFPILHDVDSVVGRAFKVYRPEMREDMPACFILNSEDRLVFFQKADSGPESLKVEQLVSVLTDLARQTR
ncbi:MAG TPA: redoxin domain-containing protein [bacterium]|nr:redoxin domain-containing protein [bacterium]